MRTRAKAALHRTLPALAALLVAGAGPPGPERESPRLLAKVAADYWQHLLARSPELRMRQGLRVEVLPDPSLADAEAEAAFARSLLARLQPVTPDELSPEETLTLEILRRQARDTIEGLPHHWLAFPVTPYSSPLPTVHRVFTTYPFSEKADGERYLALLRRYPAFVRSLQAKLEEQAERGIRLPKEELDLVVPFLTAFIRDGGHSLFFVTSERLEALGAAPAAAFQRQVSALIGSDVNPALQSLVASLGAAYREQAPEAVGLGQYPGGPEAYRYLVRLHTTLEVSPDEVHGFGLGEVERLRAEMKAVRDGLGFPGSQADFHRSLRAEPRFRAKTADQIGERLRAHAAAIEPKVDAFFLRRPKAPYGVKRLDPALEGSQTYGYYQAPTASDPAGYYFFNGSSPAERPLVNAAALIFHELVPGHHFQINLQSENEALPAFRRHSYETAYGEGWGEYASKLALEMGMYADPYDRYGRLLMEMFLASRLVVDTGMNQFRWPRARAEAFMRENVLETPTQLHTETLRYSVDMPGQALAYQMGSTKIRALREKARAALGPHFDVRRFHQAVLGSGSLPLSVLELHIDRFIEAETRRRRTKS